MTRAVGLVAAGCVLAFAVAFAVSYALAPATVRAVEFNPPFRFRHVEQISVENRLTDADLDAAFDDAVAGWDQAPELSLEEGPKAAASPYITPFSNIIFYQANYGEVQFIGSAWQTTSNLGNPCFSPKSRVLNGRCNCHEWCEDGWDTDKRADFAYIAFNDNYSDHYGDDGGDAALAYVAHELGHPLGLDHWYCGVWSVMAVSDRGSLCDPYATGVTEQDLSDIEDMYP